jgi:hypothetical protein
MQRRRGAGGGRCCNARAGGGGGGGGGCSSSSSSSSSSGIHADRGRGHLDLCTTKRKTASLKGASGRHDGLVRSCRATKLAANYGGGAVVGDSAIDHP